jgi:hypothetical protein
VANYSTANYIFTDFSREAANASATASSDGNALAQGSSESLTTSPNVSLSPSATTSIDGQTPDQGSTESHTTSPPKSFATTPSTRRSLRRRPIESPTTPSNIAPENSLETSAVASPAEDSLMDDAPESQPRGRHGQLHCSQLHMH